ncbi:hypothetical protein FHS79_002972 [Polymorphobacter multimanifer]|uniref:DUF3011 domain-containing protein n=2 Tax=Polymorphobacter multimanifer TaxID=1070431 RepID=A0A841LAV4_9SPHN|nr:DUF3011 domain-containing protein [Polymorphobacter multimanifer]MBB6228781.1 hypothetical protein [Polymorphobacter multimanifer]
MGAKMTIRGLIGWTALLAMAPLPPAMAQQNDERRWNNSQYDRTITCSSSGNRYRECRADAGGGADLLRVLGGNCGRNNWGYRTDAVWVRNGCRAEFGVRSNGFGGSGGNNGGNWGGGWQGGNGGGNNWGGNNNWQTGTVRCESRNNRRQSCRADARGGVQISRVLGGNCSRGNWGWQDNEIWVDRGCRAEFLVRGAGPQPDQGGGGPSTGAIIGGVAVAAGLAAIIAAATRKKTPDAATMPEAGPLPAGPANGGGSGPASIDVNLAAVPSAARPAFQTCLAEAARQIGATGGTAIALSEMQEIEPGNGGYRFRFRLDGSWPDEKRTIGAFCRATPTQVIELDFQ